MENIHERVRRILKDLNKGVMERERELQYAFLAAIAGESIFLIGKPGVAKSLLARRLKFAFRDAVSFEYLMNRFSTPDEIFGPVDIQKLKEKSEYERKTEGYLPSADVVFLDEIWKAGPSIQNTLLTIINEKIYRNGTQTLNVPMKALISASNELPAEGEGLEALWDRFLVRLEVSGIKKTKLFHDMLVEDLESAATEGVSPDDQISNEEYASWHKRINQIKVPDIILDVIDGIRAKINEYNKVQSSQQVQDPEQDVSLIYISDRRWRKIVHLLRASAFLNGRDEVDLMDCFLIKDCLWDKVEQIKLVEELVSGVIVNKSDQPPKELADLNSRIQQFATEYAPHTAKSSKNNKMTSTAKSRPSTSSNPLIAAMLRKQAPQQQPAPAPAPEPVAESNPDESSSLQNRMRQRKKEQLESDLNSLLARATQYKENMLKSIDDNLFVHRNAQMDKIKDNLDAPIREIMKAQTELDRITQGM